MRTEIEQMINLINHSASVLRGAYDLCDAKGASGSDAQKAYKFAHNELCQIRDWLKMDGYLEGYKNVNYPEAKPIYESPTSVIKWVSVEDRLPEDYLFRLVISKLSGDTDTAHYLRHQQRWEDPFGDAVEVTHWGELPKFPKTK